MEQMETRMEHNEAKLTVRYFEFVIAMVSLLALSVFGFFNGREIYSYFSLIGMIGVLVCAICTVEKNKSIKETDALTKSCEILKGTIKDLNESTKIVVNTATSKVSNDLFTEGKNYECTEVFVSDNVPVVDVMCDTGDMVTVSINDENFSFVLRNNKDIDKKNMPYIYGRYNPEYGDDRICICGHPYYRHFDSYDDMYPCGCKYCGCDKFVEQEETVLEK